MLGRHWFYVGQQIRLQFSAGHTHNNNDNDDSLTRFLRYQSLLRINSGFKAKTEPILIKINLEGWIT